MNKYQIINDSLNLLKAHILLTPNISESKFHYENREYWIPFIFLLSFIFLTIAKFYYSKNIKESITIFVINKKTKMASREELVFFNKVNILLSFVYFFSFSFLIYFTCLENDYPLYHSKGIKLFLIILACIGIVFGLKVITSLFVGFIFKIENLMGKYLFTHFLFIKLLGIILLPIVIGIAYLKIIPVAFLIYLGLIVSSIFLIYKIIRLSLEAVQEANISLFYLFLYLCTLEILPLMVIAKLFKFGLN